jgi:hypothetical protein
MRNAYKILVRNMKERTYLGYLDFVGRIMVYNDGSLKK